MIQNNLILRLRLAHKTEGIPSNLASLDLNHFHQYFQRLHRGLTMNLDILTPEGTFPLKIHKTLPTPKFLKRMIKRNLFFLT